MSVLNRSWSLRSFGLLSVLVLSFFVSHIYAQQTLTGVISGSVVDNSGAVLKGAQVKLLPLGVIVATDSQGEYEIPAVPAGSYTLTVSYVGFMPSESKVDIAAGEMKNTQIKLNVASANDEVIVTAERLHGEADSINQTRTADNILQVLPAEVIVSLPNANVADAIGRLPSV